METPNAHYPLASMLDSSCDHFATSVAFTASTIHQGNLDQVLLHHASSVVCITPPRLVGTFCSSTLGLYLS